MKRAYQPLQKKNEKKKKQEKTLTIERETTWRKHAACQFNVPSAGWRRD